jgi:hypothetical protein
MALVRMDKSLGKTQADVTAALGISQSRVSQIENGDLDAMGLETLRAYAASSRVHGRRHSVRHPESTGRTSTSRSRGPSPWRAESPVSTSPQRCSRRPFHHYTSDHLTVIMAAISPSPT